MCTHTVGSSYVNSMKTTVYIILTSVMDKIFALPLGTTDKH